MAKEKSRVKRSTPETKPAPAADQITNAEIAAQIDAPAVGVPASQQSPVSEKPPLNAVTKGYKLGFPQRNDGGEQQAAATRDSGGGGIPETR